AIKDSWESQCRIQNAIIDIDHKVHDFEKIFNELDNLGCEFVQLRIFSDLIDLDELTRIISLSKNKSIESIEIIIKHNISIPDKEYILFLENEPSIVNLTLHSSLTDRIIKINYELDDSRKLIFRNINIVSKNINSHMHCGIISIKNMTPPSTATFLENKLRNGCLNGKV
ncbi:MAG TPA: hypothetical protein VK590_03045, partial [Saprospiraceae bacterium]|nr:hypothetical protein [Saprospiraceae bacterium]